MKRCIRIIFLSLITLSLFVACDKIEYDMPSAGTSGTLLKVDFKMDTTLTFSYEAITSSLVFESNFSWVAEVEEQATSWLTISQTQGKPGTHEIHFSITKNEEQNIRYGRIKLYAGDTSVVVTVKQKAEDFILEGDEDGIIKIYVDDRKQETSFSFYANAEWTASIDEETYEWIKLDMSGVTGQVKLIIKVEENLQPTERTGTIIVQSDNNKSFVIQVIQEKGGDVFKYKEADATISIPDYNPSSTTFKFNARVDWTATVAEADKGWLSVDKTSGSAGDIELKITATENADFSSRTGQITITGQDSTFIVKVTQVPTPAFDYDKDNTTFSFPSSSNSTRTFTFTAYTAWTTNDSPPFTVTQKSGEAGENCTITISCPARNPSEGQSSIERTIVITAGDQSIRLTCKR